MLKFYYRRSRSGYHSESMYGIIAKIDFILQKRFLVTGIAILFLSLILLPNVVSTFTNQHTWQQTNEVGCSSCHAEINMELNNPDNYHHKPESLGVKNSDEACKYCHQIQFRAESGEYNDLSVETDSQKVHASYTVECLDCHGNSTLYNDPNAVNVADDFKAPAVESHIPLFDEAVTRSLRAGANEACIACHTGMAIQYDRIYFSSIQMNITVQPTRDGWVVEIDVNNP